MRTCSLGSITFLQGLGTNTAQDKHRRLVGKEVRQERLTKVLEREINREERLAPS
jgi:hypothetical protein